MLLELLQRARRVRNSTVMPGMYTDIDIDIDTDRQIYIYICRYRYSNLVARAVAAGEKR